MLAERALIGLIGPPYFDAIPAEVVEAIAAGLGLVEDVVADGAFEVLVLGVDHNEVLNVDDVLVIHYNRERSWGRI